jgi:hypothetical protein
MPALGHPQRQSATLQQCYLNHDRKETRGKESAPTIPDANRMPNSKPKYQIVTACLLPGLDGRIHDPDAGIGFAE